MYAHTCMYAGNTSESVGTYGLNMDIRVGRRLAAASSMRFVPDVIVYPHALSKCVCHSHLWTTSGLAAASSLSYIPDVLVYPSCAFQVCWS